MTKLLLGIEGALLAMENVPVFAKIGHWVVDLVSKALTGMLILRTSSTAANRITARAHSDITLSSSELRSGKLVGVCLLVLMILAIVLLVTCLFMLSAMYVRLFMMVSLGLLVMSFASLSALFTLLRFGID